MADVGSYRQGVTAQIVLSSIEKALWRLRWGKQWVLRKELRNLIRVYEEGGSADALRQHPLYIDVAGCGIYRVDIDAETFEEVQ
jgi:hypothetical protein